MSVSDTIPIQLHDCEAYLEGTVIHIRPKTMDRLLSEVAPSQDSPPFNDLSNHSEPELHEDCDSPGQMIRDAEQTQQEKMTQFGQSQFYALADFTHNVIDSALADSVTTVPIYTAKISTLISVAQTQVDTSTTMTATTLETTPTSPVETIIVTTEDITQTTTSTDSSNHAPVDISYIPVTLSDTPNVPTASAQTPHTSTTVNANPFDLQTSLFETRLTTTQVVYTQGKIQFTFTMPTSTFAPH